jgi:small-conductance mechanosensitive channel
VWTDIWEVLNSPLFVLGKQPVSGARIAGLLMVMFAVWWAALLLERVIRRVAQHAGGETMSQAGVYALSRILRYVFVIVGTLAGLMVMGFDISSLAILGGAIGIGVGLGLQALFANFISGIIILVEKTLKVGDFVDLQSGISGQVAEISVRYTRIMTNDSVDVIVPNSEFVNGRVINWTFSDEIRRIHVPFSAAYGCDKNLVREAGLAAARSLPEFTLENERHRPDVWLVRFGESSLDFELVVWVNRRAVIAPGRAKASYVWALDDALRVRGLEIPFPQRDLHIRNLPPTPPVV